MPYSDLNKKREKEREYKKKYRKSHPGYGRGDIRAQKQRSRDKVSVFIKSIKSSGCCLCGYNKCLDAIEFHHIKDKEFILSRIQGRGINRIKNEISKCIVVCANCHREIHAEKINENEKHETHRIKHELQTELF
jgi:hypothetical protein